MRRFAELFELLDTTTSTNAKVDAMLDYFQGVSASDAAWAIYILIGRRLKRVVGPSLLREWLREESQLPGWLVDETYGSVGDLAETIALLVPGSTGAQSVDLSLTEWFRDRIVPLSRQQAPERRENIVSWWRTLPYRECFLVNKLLTGSLRVGVSRALVTRALAEALQQPRVKIERSLMGEWEPSPEFWSALRLDESSLHAAHPYPFYLASPLTGEPQELGPREDWLVEWKWDGIRGQIVRREAQTTLWSRGEEIITERFPEIKEAAAVLPEGTVLDGEVLGWQGEHVLPFADLQQRIGRQKVTAKILERVPARFMAYDLLEENGMDCRGIPLRQRRARLAALVEHLALPVLSLSPEVLDATWEALVSVQAQARAMRVEGLMLKRWDSVYAAGRQRGAWWKWKIDPFVLDAVLMYAAPGHGRRSNLYTDYTFGVRHGDALVPIAKAYSGLTDEEIQRLDGWIRGHTIEKFGIVRSVEPLHVFELAYEGIAASSRHKSGIALRFPRMLQWRTDKSPAEADTLEALKQVLAEQQRHSS